MPRLLLALLLALPTAAMSAEVRFWYKLTVANASVDGSGSYDFYGSSALGFQDLVDTLSKSAFVTLEDLRCWDEQDQPMSWYDYDPIHLNSVAIRSAQVVAVQPLTGDPVTVQPEGKAHKEHL